MSELSVNLNAATRAAEQVDALLMSDDQQLMIRLQQGDETAMCELLDQHGEMLARLVGRLTAWRADHEDILQDVLLSVWQRSGSFRGAGSLEGWLKRIAVNHCRNHFRAVNSITQLMERFASLVSPQPFVETHPAEPNHELHIALRRLPKKDRISLVLFYLEEMPGDEVADILQIKPETLHVRLHRARKKLKHLMEENSDSLT